MASLLPPASSGDAGALVRRSFQVGQRIHKDDAGLDGTDALTQPVCVPLFQQQDHIVDNLLQRLDAPGGGVVVVLQGIDGQLQNLQDGGPEDVHLLLGAVGETELGVIQLLCHFVKIRGIVADALDIADALHQHIQLPPGPAPSRRFGRAQ